MTGLSPAASQG